MRNVGINYLRIHFSFKVYRACVSRDSRRNILCPKIEIVACWLIGRGASGESAAAGLQRVAAGEERQHRQGVCVQAAIQDARLFLPRRERLHVPAVDAGHLERAPAARDQPLLRESGVDFPRGLFIPFIMFQFDEKKMYLKNRVQSRRRRHTSFTCSSGLF
jgi:hypothetical protein